MTKTKFIISMAITIVNDKKLTKRKVSAIVKRLLDRGGLDKMPRVIKTTIREVDRD